MEQKDYRIATKLHADISGFSKKMEENETETLCGLDIHKKINEKVVYLPKKSAHVLCDLKKCEHRRKLFL